MEEVEARPWARLKTDFAFNAFGQYTQGTVTTTQGSPIVVGVGTAWTSQMVGMSISVGQLGSPSSSTQIVPIPIDSVQSATQLTLRSPYSLGGGTSIGYQIFPLFYSIPGMSTVLGVRQQVPLGKKTHEQINLVDPYRQQRSSPATNWAPFGLDHNGQAKIELWPIETNSNPYLVYGLRGHIDMVDPSDLPLIPAPVIVAKTMAKICETLFSLTGDNRWGPQRQQFYYQRYMAELEMAIDTDRGQYGVQGQVRDSLGDPDNNGYTPGLDQVFNRDSFSNW